tara:strand:- start:277 stop:1176 length:900 start_codon:yes stop_codon:yes gene_type:complete
LHISAVYHAGKDNRSKHQVPEKTSDLDYEPKTFINKKGQINSYWWDGKPNFGDAIGPYLIEKITGKSAVNVRGDRSAAAIFSVGSIITMMDRKGCVIWGSGLIGSLDEKQKERLTIVAPNVRAVRGKLTKKILEDDLGWEIPNVFGDPALLLPDYFKPDLTEKNNIVVCPHFSHKSSFSKLAHSDNIKIIDVADPMESVVSTIASSKVCISSSLHGIVVAQAYGVPWVWLHFEGNHLSGSDLKFQDFFSTLHSFKGGVYEVPTNSTITQDTLFNIAGLSVLPKLSIDLEELRKAFPTLS